MFLFSEGSGPAYSSNAILIVMSALTLLIVFAYFTGIIGWMIYKLGGAFRKAVRFGFDVWRDWLSWMSWPIFLIATVALIGAGVACIDQFPLLAIPLGMCTFLLGI